jgi:anaerobic magnesium-protoporphyrin IX monomethyl ester cyclase
MMDAKIILIAPKAPMGETYHPPLGLCYISSYIKREKGISVHLLDLSIIPMKKLLKQVMELRPDIVGVTCFSPNRFSSLDIVREIKSLLPETLVVAGGIHASFLYDQILKNFDSVDMVVRGEGEETVLELIDFLKEGDGLDKIRGLAFRRLSDIVVNEKRGYIKDLDSLPFPTYVEHFIHFNGKRLRGASIITSRGCSGGCKFCSVPGYWGKPRFRSTENIFEEMSILVNQYKVEYVNFMDDTFTEDKERVENLCSLIKRKNLNIKWRATARVNTLDLGVLKIMKDAGCAEISVGVESGSQDILNRFGKKTSPEKIADICTAIKALKIRLEANFIVGGPGESDKTIEETKRLIKFIKPDVFNVSQSLYLLPGTALSREFSEKGFYNEGLWLDRNIDNIKYLAEHEEHVLTRWQMELIKTGWESLPLRKRVKYISGIFKWIKISQIRKVVFNLVKTVFKN